MSDGACSWTWVDGERIDIFPDPRITELFAAIERLRSGRQDRRLGAELADDLVQLRQAEKHSVGRFRKDCAHARHAADAEGYLAEQVDLVEARSLEFLPRGDGALILKGFLDAEGGATLRTALEPLARRMDAADDRERERRLADALVELAGHNLDAGLIRQRAGQRPP